MIIEYVEMLYIFAHFFVMLAQESSRGCSRSGQAQSGTRAGSAHEDCINCNQLRIENDVLERDNRALRCQLVLACDGK